MSFFEALAKRKICSPPGPRTDYWYSYELLAGLPVDPAKWFGWESDFTHLPTGQWTVTQATAGTMVTGDAHGGVAVIDSGSTTAAQGANCQLGGTAGEWVMPAAGRIVIWSSRVKLTGSGTGPEIFVGVHETDTTIIASSALSGANMVGFSSVTDNNVALFTAEKASAAANKTGFTLIDDTWALLEWKITGVTKIEGFVNGSRLVSSDHVTANIPIVEMRPSLVCHSSGTTQPILIVDNLGCWVYDPNR